MIKTKPLSQKQNILNSLLKGYKITALDALNNFGCLEFHARINELRDQVVIKDKWIQLKNGKRVKQYFIESMILVMFLFLPVFGYSQPDSIKVYSHVEVLRKPGGFVLQQDEVIVKDDKSQVIKFKHAAAGLNYMVAQGWKFEQWHYMINVPCFLISRKVVKK